MISPILAECKDLRNDLQGMDRSVKQKEAELSKAIESLSTLNDDHESLKNKYDTLRNSLTHSEEMVHSLRGKLQTNQDDVMTIGIVLLFRF